MACGQEQTKGSAAPQGRVDAETAAVQEPAKDALSTAGETAEDVKQEETVVLEGKTGPGTGAAAGELHTYGWDEAVVYEAEDGELLGNARLEGDHVTGLAEDGDGLRLQVSVEASGFYDLDFITEGQGGYKENYVFVDGGAMGNIVTDGSGYVDAVISRVYLEAGSHTVEVKKFWGWINIDRLLVKPSDDIDPVMYQLPYTLVNANADENTRRLFSYLVDNYGNHILSGQYCDTGMLGAESAAVESVAGDYPAILGLDLIEYTPSRVAHGSKGNQTELAIDYWNKGGIVTFCWHWNAPEKYLSGVWYSGFYTEHTDIDLARIMNGQDPEGYDLLMADIDAIARELQKMQEAGVPVLWRPLHEASGGWFWWGAAGPEAYKKLYVLLYEKLTEEYGLNNLIWIWNGQDREWYPGDAYVDIIGEDIYPGEHVYTPQTDRFFEAAGYTPARKMVVLSENGCLFDPELAARDGAWWGFFCTWQREFVRRDTAIVSYSEQYTEKDMVRKVYEDERVISRSELPDLKAYPIGGQ
ncbi:MAG: beta-mannosidase [Lachnospiraceae bacterium]|nr:beta-mannosidase [Lachnospiraceae bacterium]